MNIYRKLAIWSYRREARAALEKDKIMEEFITQNILDGGGEEFIAKQRSQLLFIQNEIKAKKRLIEFLSGVK